MSFILNALRKSEREREHQQPTTLADRLQPEQPSHVSAKIKTAALIVLLGLNAAVLIYLLSTRSSSTPPVTPSKQNENETRQLETETPEETATVAPVMPQPEAKPSAGEKRQDRSPTLTIADLLASNQSAAATQPQAVNTEPPTAKSSRPDVPDSDLPSDIAFDGAPVQQEEPAPKTDLLHETDAIIAPADHAQQPKESTVAANRVPWLKELPDEFWRQVPAVAFNVYVYSDTPVERFVMVDWKKFRTGEEILPGMWLKDIQRDGIVVEYKNEQFKIKRE